MMNNMSEKDRRALRVGGIGAGAILLFILVGSPVMDYWERLNDRVETSQKKLRDIESGVLETVEANGLMEKLRASATVYPEPTGLNTQTAQMVQRVQSLPGYGSITIRRMEPMALQERDEFYRSAVSLQFGGTLSGLHRFLAEVQSANPRLKVERLDLTANAKDSTKIDGQMVISGYAVVAQKAQKAQRGRRTSG